MEIRSLGEKLAADSKIGSGHRRKQSEIDSYICGSIGEVERACILLLVVFP